MTTINNIEDLARILETQPHWAATLRTLLLGNELLALPETVANLAETVRELQAGQERLTQAVRDLQEGQARLQEGQEELARIILKIQEQQERFDDRQDRLEAIVADLRGFQLEARLHRRIRPLLSQRLSFRAPVIIQSELQGPNSEFVSEVSQARQDGLITDTQDARIAESDFIMRARRRDDASMVWIAVEAANRVKEDDIERARDTADALDAIYGGDAVPVVIGYRIDEIDWDRAVADHVTVIQVPEAPYMG